MATVESAGLRVGSTLPKRVCRAALSLEALRGLTMIGMIGEGFGLLYFRKTPIIGPLSNQFRQVDWNISIPDGMHFWDLILPFFNVRGSAVMPVSFARRWAAGET